MVQWVTPTGHAVRMTMVPGDALPFSPLSTARAGMSTDSPPAFSVPASVVSKRTSSAVIHTVPTGIVRSDAGARSTEKRSVPWALVPAMRLSPRMAACRSR